MSTQSRNGVAVRLMWAYPFSDWLRKALGMGLVPRYCSLRSVPCWLGCMLARRLPDAYWRMDRASDVCSLAAGPSVIPHLALEKKKKKKKKKEKKKKPHGHAAEFLRQTTAIIDVTPPHFSKVDRAYLAEQFLYVDGWLAQDQLTCIHISLKRDRSRTFTCGNHAGQCHWSAGFVGDLPFPSPLHSGAAPCSPNFTLIGSQDLGGGHVQSQEERERYGRH
ncbi:hypothetical protein PR048_008245 [Dryococelus australis]|uniref:Uncharacterized protein n=1 Tax=Dryococelus australis TaxID=614101 RepID=A0ABQ9HWK0_9NEOP|nr:hypothetical protein PR048_008245 [Dryococelus australis]